MFYVLTPGFLSTVQGLKYIPNPQSIIRTWASYSILLTCARALFHGCSMSTLSASSAWQIMVPTFRDVALKFAIFDTNASFPMTTMSFKYCVTSQQDEGLKILIRGGSPRPNLACPGDTDQIATAQKQIASTKTYSTTNHQCHKTKDLDYPI